ncbi:DUF1566 domain-containing protein [Leptospira sp. FAT2]|uniref:Lcl domain-containing protein n=1 Tax=Leptospira sanjuanensis TaxID=2879643 RepID=UPI001EE8A549|nr:DUF1566 domain-containing protein [Leptospira sanjuanensis]MCG6167246.1 DUF1566 domain-containing protein [Leptospira sanjuanensis]MCG6192671.1 DUF1566 domain-containing protein [Leptospira sanjuanensis]
MDDPKGRALLFSLLGDKDVPNATNSSSPSAPEGGPAVVVTSHSILIEPRTLSEYVGGTTQFRAYHYINGILNAEITDDVDWTSTNTGVLTISNTAGSKGLATKIAIGSSDVEIVPMSALAALLLPTYTNRKATATLAAVPDTTSPLVSSHSPPNSHTGFSPLSFELRLTFNEPMDMASVPAISFEDRIATGTYTAFSTLGYSHTWTSNTNLTIRLDALPESFSFRWTLAGSGMKDAAGNSLSANYSGTSATGAESTYVPLVDTGQIGCWNQIGTSVSCEPGMDGEITDPSPSATLAGPSVNASYPNDPITYHGLTDLTWTTCTHGQVWTGSACTGTGTSPAYGAIASTWSQAIQICGSYDTRNSGAGYAGKGGWRLPTIRELQSILDYSYTSNSIVHPIYFPNMLKSENYWSSTARVATNNKDRAFKINTFAGKTQNLEKTYQFYHYCVTNE